MVPNGYHARLGHRQGRGDCAEPAVNAMFAERLSQLSTVSPEKWVASANQTLPPLVGAVLVAAIAFKGAELAWLLVPGPDLEAPPPVVNTTVGNVATTSTAIDVEALANAHLFGEAKVEETPVDTAVVDAPETRLSLKLRGVVADEDPKTGIAMVVDNRNDEKMYRVGDQVPGGAKLHAVYEDRVILNRSGALETLSLPKDFQGTPGARTTRARRTPTTRPTPRATQDRSSLRQVISDNASKLSDIIRAAPHMQQGQMVGFRINPGRNRQQFASLGLRPGDVVTDINGTAMTDPSQGLQVFEALGESTQATVTVMRNGNPEVLVVDTSQLSAMEEEEDRE